MKEHNLDGSDPITVSQFLIYFVTEADKLNMSEGQPYLALPTYLSGTQSNNLCTCKTASERKDYLMAGRDSALPP